jgi:hypothetical protein
MVALRPVPRTAPRHRWHNALAMTPQKRQGHRDEKKKKAGCLNTLLR